ncbi:hypothetical protein I6F34_01145 [Bradyrhizobium sp. BRP05]|nr:hypothetical protein [Bradyrhizobium sp. BRP05]
MMDDLVFVAVLGQLIIQLVFLSAGALAIGAVTLIVMNLLAPDQTDEAPK